MKTIVSVLAGVIAAWSSESGQAACVKPNARALLGRDLGCCTSTVNGPLGGAGPGLRWVAVSFGAPADGYLYVVRCSGVKVAEMPLGYVERLRPAPRIGGVATIAVTYVPATGTGIQTRAVALVQYRSGKLRILWEHLILDAAYPPARLGPSYEERTSWQFLEGHRRIEVTAKRTVFGRSRRVLTLPTERYCLRSSVWRYVPCDR